MGGSDCAEMYDGTGLPGFGAWRFDAEGSSSRRGGIRICNQRESKCSLWKPIVCRRQRRIILLHVRKNTLSLVRQRRHHALGERAAEFLSFRDCAGAPGLDLGLGSRAGQAIPAPARFFGTDPAFSGLCGLFRPWSGGPHRRLFRLRLVILTRLGDSGPGPDDDSDLARESGVIGLFNVVYFLFDEVNDDSTIDRIKKCLQGIR